MSHWALPSREARDTQQYSSKQHANERGGKNQHSSRFQIRVRDAGHRHSQTWMSRRQSARVGRECDLQVIVLSCFTREFADHARDNPRFRRCAVRFAGTSASDFLAIAGKNPTCGDSRRTIFASHGIRIDTHQAMERVEWDARLSCDFNQVQSVVIESELRTDSLTRGQRHRQVHRDKVPCVRPPFPDGKNTNTQCDQCQAGFCCQFHEI